VKCSFRVTYTKDTKIPNAGTYVILKEDHTLGNLIRMQLYRDPKVLFCGYRIPHPLEHSIQIKVQTDGSYGPEVAMKNALNDIARDLTALEKQIQKATRPEHRH